MASPIDYITKLSPKRGDVLIVKVNEDVDAEKLAAALEPTVREIGCYLVVTTVDIDFKLLDSYQKHVLISELSKPIQGVENVQ